MSRFAALLLDEDDTLAYRFVQGYVVVADASDTLTSVIQDVDDNFQEIIDALRPLPACVHEFDVEKALIGLIREPRMLSRAIRAFADIGWGDDDGQCKHVVDRLLDCRTFNAVDFLKHVGLWMYSEVPSYLPPKHAPGPPKSSQKRRAAR